MDAHFHEYLAAVAGMQEIYGEPADETHAERAAQSDFHQQGVGDGEAGVAMPPPCVTTAAA